MDGPTREAVRNIEDRLQKIEQRISTPDLIISQVTTYTTIAGTGGVINIHSFQAQGRSINTKGGLVIGWLQANKQFPNGAGFTAASSSGIGLLVYRDDEIVHTFPYTGGVFPLGSAIFVDKLPAGKYFYYVAFAWDGANNLTYGNFDLVLTEFFPIKAVK